MTAVRICPACRQEKPEEAFYLQIRDGYAPRRMGVCKACHKARVRRRAVERRAKRQELPQGVPQKA
jgi:hypothetical protein